MFGKCFTKPAPPQPDPFTDKRDYEEADFFTYLTHRDPYNIWGCVKPRSGCFSEVVTDEIAYRLIHEPTPINTKNVNFFDVLKELNDRYCDILIAKKETELSKYKDEYHELEQRMEKTNDR